MEPPLQSDTKVSRMMESGIGRRAYVKLSHTHGAPERDLLNLR